MKKNKNSSIVKFVLIAVFLILIGSTSYCIEKERKTNMKNNCDFLVYKLMYLKNRMLASSR